MVSSKKISDKHHKYILVTSGEPAGIGPELVSYLARFNNTKLRPIILINGKLLQERLSNHKITCNCLAKIGADDTIINTRHIARFNSNLDSINYFDFSLVEPVIAGKLNFHNSNYVLQQINFANHLLLTQSKIFVGLLTCPINKEAIIRSKSSLFEFQGHTEYLQKISQSRDVLMVLSSQKINVGLVTTHIPLAIVANKITPDLIISKLEIVNNHYKKYYNRHANIIVAGLNPHAGENGSLGMEELTIINPAINTYKKCNSGASISLAKSADTMFSKNSIQKCDLFLCMYHDQCLPVFKTLSFGKGVNITLGLPYLRVSVDHGSALDIADKGIASPSSLLYAYKFITNLLC